LSRWSVICCTSGSEIAAIARAARLGFPDGYYPTREVSAISGAQKRGLRAARKRGAQIDQPAPKKRIVAEIAGYIFVPGEVPPHIIRSQPEARLWMRSLVVNAKPVYLTEQDMMQMAQMPQVLRERLDKMEKQALAELEAKRPKVGQDAIVKSGQWEGSRGKVEEVTDTDAMLDMGGLLRKVRVSLDVLEGVV
jgi:transcription antitermination factor NusG